MMDSGITSRLAATVRQTFPPANRRSLKVTSGRALRLYRKIANNRSFAKRIAQGQRSDDPHNALEKLIRPLYIAPIFITGFNGFLVNFQLPYPTNGFGIFSNGRKRQDPTADQIRIMATAIVPLFRKISLNNAYADRVVRAINMGNSAGLSRIVRETVKSPRLRQVFVYREQPSPEFEPDIGFQLVFKFGNLQFECTVA